MSCYRCGTRQVDPDRGESPWRRGVRADRQVLVCPGCQEAGDWTADLDRCPVCAGVRLVRRLGETECRDCGAVRPAGVPAAGVPEAGGGQAGGGPATGERSREGSSREGPELSREGSELSREVAAALDRVLGRARA